MTKWVDVHWATSVYSAPAVEPVTVAEAKAQCRLDTTVGEPAPTAMTVALSAVAGNVTAGAHRYLATFVTADGETEAGAISASVTTILATHGQVALSAIPIGGSAVTARKLYRTAAGGSTYLLLATISNNTATTYTDNIADGSLGAQAPTTNTTADALLSALITSAREHTEDACSRAWITQTRDLVLDEFPEGLEPILIPRLPLISVTSITYIDTAGATQTWSNTLYDVDITSGRIAPAYGQVYPTTEPGTLAAVTVRFVCGYGAAASTVPSRAKSAMKLLVAHSWAHRGDAKDEGREAVDLAVDTLLAPLKVSF